MFVTDSLSTCDLSLLDGEWDDEVERSQPRHIQTIQSHRSVRCLGDRGQRSVTEKDDGRGFIDDESVQKWDDG